MPRKRSREEKDDLRLHDHDVSTSIDSTRTRLPHNKWDDREKWDDQFGAGSSRAFDRYEAQSIYGPSHAPAAEETPFEDSSCAPVSSPQDASSCGPGRASRSVPNHSSIPVVLEAPTKAQCFDHGCNGRTFSTFSNLLRHQREKSGSSSKAVCHRCGAIFTRKTALNGHLAHDKCKLREADEISRDKNKAPKSDDGHRALNLSKISPLVIQEDSETPVNTLQYQQQSLTHDEPVRWN